MSFTARILHLLMKMSGFKFVLGWLFNHPPHWLFTYWHTLLPNDLNLTWHNVSGRRIATLSHPDKEARAHVVFLHGGGYSLGFFPMFIRCLVRWVKDQGLRVSLVDYPLAPTAGVHEIQAFVDAAYQHIRATYPDDNLCLMGDSAGGTLALVQCQKLRDSDSPLPHKTILVSPWVDADMTREFSPYSEREVLLTTSALRRAIDNYRRDLSLDDPRISPIYGGLNDLGEVAVVAGSGELFFPDVVRLREAMSLEQGTSVLWFEGDQLWHDWLYFAVPEAKRTRADLGRWLAS